MDFLHRVFDKAEWLLSGWLAQSSQAGRWHKEDLTDWKAWTVFLITGASCALYLTGMVSTYLGVTDPGNCVKQVGETLGVLDVDQKGRHLMALARAEQAVDAGRVWVNLRHNDSLAAIATDLEEGGYFLEKMGTDLFSRSYRDGEK
ncbi:MFS transporter [Pseudomonas batumici]|uniref:MFS transporter n=1 Tax=Pseudomonas batumici TaxID=226910 RepID=UPI0030D41358